MKRTHLLTGLLVALFATAVWNMTVAQATAPPGQHGPGFVDQNGDGFNDLARDHDGDGIPNGMDEDYLGSRAHHGHGSRGFIDVNGDGINDRAQDFDNDGIPNGRDSDWVCPRDGSSRKSVLGAARGHHARAPGMWRGRGACGLGPLTPPQGRAGSMNRGRAKSAR